MGKCKKRTLGTKINSDFDLFCLTRQDAVKSVIELLSKTKSENIKKTKKRYQNYKQDLTFIISRFGITSEELSEAGASYEDLLGLGNLID